MMEFVNWYLSSLAEFWGTAVRIGLPQLLLVILLICWIRRSRCGKSAAKSCCGVWSWGTGCGRSESAPCGCTCGGCRCQTGAGECGDDGDGDGDS